jgi:hypothetical protein
VDQADEPVEWDNDEEEQKRTGWRLLKTYFRESNIPSDLKPEAVEVPVEADLSKHGLPKLIGVIDLVQQGRIIDFKTCSSTPNPERAAHTNEVQASSYSLLYREATGKREMGIELHHLVKLKNPKIVITSLEPMNDSQEKRILSSHGSLRVGIGSPRFHPLTRASMCQLRVFQRVPGLVLNIQ